MIAIGITGGIGSGKTTVSGILTTMGYPIYMADLEAKRLIGENSQIKNGLIEKFGEAIFENDTLNKKLLSELIFGNEENLQFVNSLVHPHVIQDFLEWKERQTSPVVFIEAAILFETNLHNHVDKKIVVVAPFELRISRVEKRDNLTREEIMDRISKQMEDDEKTKLADFIINNDEKTNLLPQICSILNEVYDGV